MTAIQMQLSVTPDQLLQGIEQLDESQFSWLSAQIKLLEKQRQQARRLINRETELLYLINQGLPQETLLRYHELKEKGDMQTNTENEEMIQIVLQMESMATKRLDYIAKLAELRQITPTDLMRELQHSVSI